MKRGIIKIATLVAALVFSVHVFADVFNEPQTLQSPDVATLNLYQEPEVALQTGTASVSIPIYQVSIPGYTLPIALQYNGHSVQIDQLPSWIGMGWNLSAGGAITRRINDAPDDIEYDENHFYSTLDHAGFYWQCASLSDNRWNNFNTSNPNSTTFDYAYYDTEPDEFYFSFPGYEGKFYLNHNGRFVVQCNKSISVKLLGHNIEPPFVVYSQQYLMKRQPYCFSGFVMTIEDGTQFVFGADTSAIDFCTPLFDSQQTMVATAWHLTKIITPGKLEINLKYQRKKFTYELYETSQMVASTSSSGNGFLSSSYGTMGNSQTVSGKLLSPVYLQEIESPDVKISFRIREVQDLQYSDACFDPKAEYLNQHAGLMPYITNNAYTIGKDNYISAIRNKTAHYALSCIAIKSKDINQDSVFVGLTHSFNSSYRLMLTGVRIFSDAQYIFEYNDYSHLPGYLSHMTDHWGYYNGTTSNYAQTITDYYNYREPHSYLIYSGMLSAVKYPTGAKCVFEYESNTYRKRVAELRWQPLIEETSNKQGGGARIKSISYYNTLEDTQPTSKREFYYTTNYINNPTQNVSSGILGSSFKYYYNHTYSGNNYSIQLFTTGNVLPYCGGDCFVHYSEVTEKTQDGGYRVYKYTNYNDYLDEAPIETINPEDIYFVPCTSTHHRRGLIKEISDYNSNRSLVHRTSYTYTPNRSESDNIRSMYQTVVDPSDGYNYSTNFEVGAKYMFYTQAMVISEQCDTKYANGRPYDIVTTHYDYDLRTQMIQRTQTATTMDTTLTEYIYAYDVLGPSFDPNSSILVLPHGPHSDYNTAFTFASAMSFAHVYLPWEITTKRNGKVVHSQFFDYLNNTEGVYSISKVYSLGNVSPLESFTHVNLLKERDPSYHSAPDIHLQYDSNGNIIMINNKGLQTRYIWAYNNTRIVAKIEDWATTLESPRPMPAYFISSFPSQGELSLLRQQILNYCPNALCYTYLYNPLVGMISETLPNGSTQYYNYDSSGRLAEVYMLENGNKSILKKYYYHLYEVRL